MTYRLGMAPAFECSWSVTGLGGFIVEIQLLVTEDGIGVMNRLPDALAAPCRSGRRCRQHLPRRGGLVRQTGGRQGLGQHKA
ncbi:MAG: hypothetical protein INF92_03790 [Rhodobacter sp.]|nr:hypothetical protein [Rhodobacter sp.]